LPVSTVEVSSGVLRFSLPVTGFNLVVLTFKFDELVLVRLLDKIFPILFANGFTLSTTPFTLSTTPFILLRNDLRFTGLGFKFIESVVEGVRFGFGRFEIPVSTVEVSSGRFILPVGRFELPLFGPLGLVIFFADALCLLLCVVLAEGPLLFAGL
jgi:hypothetical protein